MQEKKKKRQGKENSELLTNRLFVGMVYLPLFYPAPQIKYSKEYNSTKIPLENVFGKHGKRLRTVKATAACKVPLWKRSQVLIDRFLTL